MSKLSFRARQLDASKHMPVLKADEIPDVPDFTAINRAVPQMPTGMEKEEESEHHLQRALCAQQAFGSAQRLVIPIPDIEDVGESYEKLYVKKSRDFKQPKQYIHVQPFGMDHEIPDYDMDSEDEQWLTKQAKNLKMEVTALKFENMMDRLEKGSGQTVVSLQDAKALLKEDDDLTIAVYDYWLNKRLRLQHPLIPSVKTEKRDGSTTSNPYVAFRRRTEKMQTRKNRKNDEASYEKMLKLKRNLSKALTILEMMKRREKGKKEHVTLDFEVTDHRYKIGDWDGKMLNEAMSQRHKMQTLIPLASPYMPRGDWAQKDDVGFVRKKREYRKRKHKVQHQTQQQQSASSSAQPSVQLPRYSDLDALQPDAFSSDDEVLSPPHSVSDQETEDDPDGIYAFKRKAGCFYHAPICGEGGDDLWGGGRSDAPLQDDHFRFNLASINHPKRCLGFVRRRRGRGGRIHLDRGLSMWDDALGQLDLSSTGMPDLPTDPILAEYYAHVSDSNILHFRPCSPVDDSAPSVIRCVTPEFSFHSHQEQLLQMQQEQQQQQALLLTPTPLLNEPSSSLTLDASSAQFAASAVCSTDSSHGNPVSPAVEVVTEEIAPISVKCNGPSVECAASSCFSTSPAANVLQLNFPLTPSTPLQSATPEPSLTSSSLCATTVTTPAIATEAMAPGTPPVLKIAATPGTQNNALPKNHGAEVKTIVHDQIVAMEVT